MILYKSVCSSIIQLGWIYICLILLNVDILQTKYTYTKLDGAEEAMITNFYKIGNIIIPVSRQYLCIQGYWLGKKT